MNNEVKRIVTQKDFVQFTRDIGVQRWREPDQQHVFARVEGLKFDNAGF